MGAKEQSGRTLVFSLPGSRDIDHSEDFGEKIFLDISQKKFGSAYAQSPRKCSNFEILAKIEGNLAKFFLKIYQGHIRI